MIKNLPFNAGDVGFISGGGTKTPHAARKLSPYASTTECALLTESLHTEPHACARYRGHAPSGDPAPLKNLHPKA